MRAKWAWTSGLNSEPITSPSSPTARAKYSAEKPGARAHEDTSCTDRASEQLEPRPDVCPIKGKSLAKAWSRSAASSGEGDLARPSM